MLKMVYEGFRRKTRIYNETILRRIVLPDTQTICLVIAKHESFNIHLLLLKEAGFYHRDLFLTSILKVNFLEGQGKFDIIDQNIKISFLKGPINMHILLSLLGLAVYITVLIFLITMFVRLVKAVEHIAEKSDKTSCMLEKMVEKLEGRPGNLPPSIDS